jgi:hypothetical protein
MRRFARPATVLLLASLLPYRIQGQESKVPKVTTVADAGGVVIPDVGTTGVLRAGAARIEIHLPPMPACTSVGMTSRAR